LQSHLFDLDAASCDLDLRPIYVYSSRRQNTIQQRSKQTDRQTDKQYNWYLSIAVMHTV